MVDLSRVSRVEQRSGCVLALRPRGLAHGGEPEPPGRCRVVEAHDGQVLGDPQAQPGSDAEGALAAAPVAPSSGVLSVPWKTGTRRQSSPERSAASR
jgi:hypothetical protein